MAFTSSTTGASDRIGEPQLSLPLFSDEGPPEPQIIQPSATKQVEEATSEVVNPKIYSAEFARIETSMLYLPFFALGTRNLHTHPGINFTSRKKFNGMYAEFCYKVSGNKDYGHPGPLSRKVHHALMAKFQEDEKMPPYQKPIEWEWNELQERIGWTSRGGRNNEELRAAIKATLGATITTNLNLHQLHSGAKPSRKEKGFHLYSAYTFAEEVMPDGKTVADTNYLWVADWYLANLNNNYVAPINYRLWSSINDRSPVASRLYEYLIYNFAAGNSVVKIGYPKLASALPVRCERYESNAKKQMNPALDSLKRHHVIDGYEWTTGVEGQLLLKIFAGQLIGEHRKCLKQNSADPTTLRHDAADLVRIFHSRLRNVDDHQVTGKERAHAAKVIEWFGFENAQQRVSRVVANIRTNKFDCRVFGGSMPYWETERRRAAREKKTRVLEDDAQQKQQEQDQRRAGERLHKDALWNQFELMVESDQKEIVETVKTTVTSNYVRQKIAKGDYTDPLVRGAILTEVERQLAS